MWVCVNLFGFAERVIAFYILIIFTVVRNQKKRMVQDEQWNNVTETSVLVGMVGKKE